MRLGLALFLMCPVVGPLAAQQDIPAMIRGVYAHPGPIWDKGLRLDELGINAVFVRSVSLDSATIERARDENCHVFAEFATLMVAIVIMWKNIPKPIPSTPRATPWPRRHGSWVPAPPTRGFAATACRHCARY